MFIPDPTFTIPDSGLTTSRIPDPDLHQITRSGFFSSRIQGSKSTGYGSGFATMVDLHRAAVSRHEILNEPSLFGSFSRISRLITKNIPVLYCKAYLVHETQR
jgi:hypothetical protein